MPEITYRVQGVGTSPNKRNPTRNDLVLKLHFRKEDGTIDPVPVRSYVDFTLLGEGVSPYRVGTIGSYLDYLLKGRDLKADRSPNDLLIWVADTAEALLKDELLPSNVELPDCLVPLKERGRC